MTDKSIWAEEIPVPGRVIAYIDSGLLNSLPAGTVPVKISPSGSSYWARTARIQTTDADGKRADFFVKVHQGDHGKDMASSEFCAMSELYKVVPEMVSEPIAWGSYAEMEDIHFYVVRYRELADMVPNVLQFPAMVAEMHWRGVSPTGQFGTPQVVYGGRNPQVFPLSESWEVCFTKCLKHVLGLEEETHGRDDELDQLKKGLFDKVIPRLLRPLETEGRTLTPRIVHGDLWDGNASIDARTGQPLIFDGPALYAHNEYELAPWRAPRHRMARAYINEYTKHFPISEPAEDFDDRGALYMLRFDTLSSSLYPGNLRFRILMKENMRDLLDKYPLGYEGYLRERGLAPVSWVAVICDIPILGLLLRWLFLLVRLLRFL